MFERFLVIALGFVLFIQPASGQVNVYIEDGYQIIETNTILSPPPDSRVTWVLGGGEEFRPDGKIYINGSNTGRNWGFVPNSTIVLTGQEFERLAIEKGADVRVYLGSGEVQIGNERDGSERISISDPNVRARMGTGFVFSPSTSQGTFVIGKTEYRPDGKVYFDGQPTGESWGIPYDPSLLDGGGESSWLGEAINGTGGELALQGILVFKKALEAEATREAIAREKRKFYQHQQEQVEARDGKVADLYEKKSDELRKSRSDSLNKTMRQISQYYWSSKSERTSSEAPTWGQEFDPDRDHVRYHFGENQRDQLVINAKRAAAALDFERLRKIADLFQNSNHIMPSEIAKNMRNGIMLPEQIDPSLPTSPLSELKKDWDETTREGQLATRTANKLQARWGEQKAFSQAIPEHVLQYLTSLSFFRQGIELLKLAPDSAISYFYLSQSVLEFGVGSSVGLYESLISLKDTTIALTGMTKDFFKKTWDDPYHPIDVYHRMLSSLPQVKQALIQEVVEKWDVITSGSAYERGRAVGELLPDLVISYATAGSGAIVTRGASAAAKSLKDTLIGVKRSGKWIRANSELLDDYTDFVSKVKNIEFHSPVQPGPLHGVKANGRSSVELDPTGRPLVPTKADTFAGGSYMSYQLTQPKKLIRVYTPGKNRRLGEYWSDQVPAGPTQAILDSALLPHWGNKATDWVIIEVPPGTRLFEGRVAPQMEYNYKLPGGGAQIMVDIEEIPKSWVKHYGTF